MNQGSKGPISLGAPQPSPSGVVPAAARAGDLPATAKLRLGDQGDGEPVLASIIRAPIVPTVFPIDDGRLGTYATVLHEEGYPALEVLLRPPEDGLRVFAEICHRPERRVLYWGLGTVLTEKTARRALEFQPDFLVSPAFSRAVLRLAAAARVPYIPGVRTFQDVQTVLEAFEQEALPVRVLKLSPVEGLSPEYIRMLRGCFPGITLCPTGEVTGENLSEWKTIPGIGAPMGSGFVPQSCLVNGEWPAVREILRRLRAVCGQAQPAGEPRHGTVLRMGARRSRSKTAR